MEPLAEEAKVEKKDKKPASASPSHKATDERSKAMAGEGKKKRKCLITGALFPVVALLLFAFAYYLNFNTVAQIKDLGNESISKYFNTYGVYGGVGLGLLSLIVAYILMGIKRLVRLSRFTVINPIILALTYAPWYYLGASLAQEKRYTDIARAVLDILVDPIRNASLFMLYVAGVWLVIEIVVLIVRKFKPAKSTTAMVVLLLGASLFGTGCTLSDLEEFACTLLPDSDHCYQAAAMQAADPYGCEKIKGERFKSGGSNPPQDKCYLNIAENTGDLDACKRIKGGLMSYTPEECYLNVAVKFEDPNGCKLLTGENKNKCRTALGEKIDPSDVVAVDNQIEELKSYLAKGDDPELTKQLKGLEDKRADLLDVLSKTNKAEYEKISDPINKDILGDYAVGDLDRESKDKLIALNEKLKAQGVTMTKEEMKSFKDYYKFMSDPANDIEQMDDTKIVKDRWNEKLGNVVDKLKIWKTNDTPQEQAQDEQLRFYQRMLERQEAINDKLTELQQDFKRNADMVQNAAVEKIQDMVKEKIVEETFGELLSDETGGIATAVLGEAIDEVKSQAQAKEFRGLVRAYNMGMQEELGKFGGDVDKAHAAVTKILQENPYEYEDQNTFAKYGNLIENKDCDGSNPHCLNKDIFWKAMKKSYKYQHQN